MSASDRSNLRKQLRAKRRAVNEIQRQQAAEQLATRVLASKAYQTATNIAAYLASDGEIDPALIVKAALADGKQVYLPIIDKPQKGMLSFHRFDHHQHHRLTANRYGIAEPLPDSPAINTCDLDLVLLPLVGFDPQAHRLGMGGGFYDKTFALENREHKKPYLMGLAFECQRVTHLPQQAHDVRLCAVITESSLYQGSTWHIG